MHCSGIPYKGQGLQGFRQGLPAAGPLPSVAGIHGVALKEYPLALIPLPGGLPTPTPWRNIAGPEQSCPQEAEDCDVDAANTRNTNHPSGILRHASSRPDAVRQRREPNHAADDEWIANYTDGGLFDLFRLRTKTDRPRLGRFSFFGISGCHCLA